MIDSAPCKQDSSSTSLTPIIVSPNQALLPPFGMLATSRNHIEITLNCVYMMMFLC